MSVHVSESREEVEFIGRGSGGWPDLLKRLGAWDPEWRAPACSPIAYLDRLGFWDERTLAVHAVQAGEADLAVLARRGVTVVTCPRSNAWVGAGVPPVEAFYRSGARVAIGTDSLTSVADLNLFTELAESGGLRRESRPPTCCGARRSRAPRRSGSARPTARSRAGAARP